MTQSRLSFLKPVVDQYEPFFAPVYAVYVLVTIFALHWFYAETFGLWSDEFVMTAFGTWIGVCIFALLVHREFR